MIYRKKSGVFFAFFVLIKEFVRKRSFLDTIDRLGGGKIFTLYLTLGFIGSTGNIDRDRCFNFRMKRQNDACAGRWS